MPGLYDQDDPFYEPLTTIPDMLPHGGVVRYAPTLENLQQGTSPDSGGGDPLSELITSPGQRPEIQMRATMYALTVGTSPTPLTASRLSVDTFVIDNISTNVNSVFFGYGSGISTVSGLEVRAGIPLVWQPDNQREMWELQRQLEYIAGLIGAQANVPNLPVFRSPRVVLDPSQWFLVASASTTISVSLIYIPEQQ